MRLLDVGLKVAAAKGRHVLQAHVLGPLRTAGLRANQALGRGLRAAEPWHRLLSFFPMLRRGGLGSFLFFTDLLGGPLPLLPLGQLPVVLEGNAPLELGR